MPEIGLAPTSPVTAESATLVMPLLVRIANSPDTPSSTGASGYPHAAGEVCVASTASAATKSAVKDDMFLWEHLQSAASSQQFVRGQRQVINKFLCWAPQSEGTEQAEKCLKHSPVFDSAAAIHVATWTSSKGTDGNQNPRILNKHHPK